MSIFQVSKIYVTTVSLERSEPVRNLERDADEEPDEGFVEGINEAELTVFSVTLPLSIFNADDNFKENNIAKRQI